MPRRVLQTASEIIEQNVRMRTVIEKSVAVLRRCALPNNFLGRKTQEPFPMEAEDSKRDED